MGFKNTQMVAGQLAGLCLFTRFNGFKKFVVFTQYQLSLILRVGVQFHYRCELVADDRVHLLEKPVSRSVGNSFVKFQVE